MTIAASGALRATAIRTEYSGTTPMRLGDYRRGHASGWVKTTTAGNSATNLSAGVPLSTAPLRMAHFRSQAKGWSYTNTTVRTNNFYFDSVFGTDWTVAWPKTFINNAAMGATTTGFYACIINGGSGGFSLVNNAEIQGAGGASPSAVGQHALLIQNTVAGTTRPIITNNSAIRGGGGAGGTGGVGGTGGATHYIVYEPAGGSATLYARDSTCWRIAASDYYMAWGGTALWHATTSPGQGFQVGASAYFTDSVLRESYSGFNGYGIRRQTGYDSPAGGAGGAGGAGAVGQGYGVATGTGANGAAGVAGVQYATGLLSGNGGTGGKGGNGGAWGVAGTAGATGATGQSGSSSVAPFPTAGVAGAAGGAKGFAINATSPWGLAVTGTLSGSYTGTAPT